MTNNRCPRNNRDRGTGSDQSPDLASFLHLDPDLLPSFHSSLRGRRFGGMILPAFGVGFVIPRDHRRPMGDIMNMATRLGTLALAFTTAAGLGTAAAHHSMTMYDNSGIVTVDGTVVEVRWSNPHVVLVVVGKDEGGLAATWTLETSSPVQLEREAGWTPAALRPGDHVRGELNPNFEADNRTGRLWRATVVDTGVRARHPVSQLAAPSLTTDRRSEDLAMLDVTRPQKYNAYDAPHADLREFLRRIEAAGELLARPGAHWDLEIGALAEIVYHAQARAAGAPVRDVAGYPQRHPLLSGATNSSRRLALTLGFPVPNCRSTSCALIATA